VTRNFTWYGDYEVQLRGDGYETLKTHAQLTAPWWQWPPIDLVAELLPFWFTDDRSVSFVLNSASAEPADGQTMLDRAGDMREQLESSEHTRAAPGTR
jgi:hypothetical protein